jgi:hypothetical protein
MWQHAQVELLRRAVRAAEEATDRASAAGRDAAAKAQREVRSAEEHAAEAAAALARERSDRRADAASFADERKELQVCAQPRSSRLTPLACVVHGGTDALSGVNPMLRVALYSCRQPGTVHLQFVSAAMQPSLRKAVSACFRSGFTACVA